MIEKHSHDRREKLQKLKMPATSILTLKILLIFFFILFILQSNIELRFSELLILTSSGIFVRPEEAKNQSWTNVFHTRVFTVYCKVDTPFLKKVFKFILSCAIYFKTSTNKQTFLPHHNIQTIQFWLESNKMSDLRCMYIVNYQKKIKLKYYLRWP